MALPYRHRQEMNGPFSYITVMFKLLNMSILLIDRAFYLSALMSSNRKKKLLLLQGHCIYKERRYSCTSLFFEGLLACM